MGSRTEAREIADGRTVLVGEAGRAELFHASEGRVLRVAAPSVDAAQETATGCLRRMAGASTPNLFTSEGLAAERRGAVGSASSRSSTGRLDLPVAAEPAAAPTRSRVLALTIDRTRQPAPARTGGRRPSICPASSQPRS